MLAYDQVPIKGSAGIVTAVIDGNVVELAELKTLEASIDFNKSDYGVMGDTGRRHKNGAWTGTGSATYHWLSSRFVKMAIDIARTGKMIYFTITATNDDPANAAAGSQTIKLGQVSIDGADILHLDVDSEMLEGSFDFTFSEVSGLKYFD
jgi:hypothetical protein